MIRLIVSDVSHTLGLFDKPDTTEVLRALSPLPEHVITEEERRVLHRASALTDEVLQDLCDALLIRRSDWPETWPDGGFTAFDYTPAVLTELSQLAPVVTLSNLSITYGPRRMQNLLEQCGPLLSGIFTSYELGSRKPAPWLWRYIADHYHVHTNDVVHIGAPWYDDICGATAAGARAIFLASTHRSTQHVPPLRDWPASPNRIAIVDDLRQVPDVIEGWHTL
jgi:FMN phosphatase YigB (HAD superfamily)